MFTKFNDKLIAFILEDIRSVLNVGAILRTADGAGLNEVICTGITPTPNLDRVHKTALGAEESMKWSYYKTTNEAIKRLENEGFKIYCVEQTNSAKEYTDIEFEDKIALIFGNELTGVQPETLKMVKNHIILPMLGKKNSLNVSTCAGILAYYLRFNAK